MATCKSCSVALTFHKRAAVVRCHYCDYRAARRAAPSAAPTRSRSRASAPRSSKRPWRRLPRGARGAARSRRRQRQGKSKPPRAHARARQIDILVGTQMVTKGHDLPNVTLVGVVNADAALSIPDYRASERTFQLLVQVAGRAGAAKRRERFSSRRGIRSTRPSPSPLVTTSTASSIASSRSPGARLPAADPRRPRPGRCSGRNPCPRKLLGARGSGPIVRSGPHGGGHRARARTCPNRPSQRALPVSHHDSRARTICAPCGARSRRRRASCIAPRGAGVDRRRPGATAVSPALS
jgi:hypothetical protein